MNWKKILVAFIVVYVVGMIYNYLVHGVLLTGAYEAVKSVFRPEADMNRLMWVQFITAFFISFFLVYIFAKGYQGRGIMEGVRYGLVMWAFVSVPMNFGQYMVYPLPYSLVWIWLISDLVIFVITGIIICLIYKPLEAVNK
jgi:hypothetical protein